MKKYICFLFLFCLQLNASNADAQQLINRIENEGWGVAEKQIKEHGFNKYFTPAATSNLELYVWLVHGPKSVRDELAKLANEKIASLKNENSAFEIHAIRKKFDKLLKVNGENLFGSLSELEPAIFDTSILYLMTGLNFTE